MKEVPSTMLGLVNEEKRFIILKVANCACFSVWRRESVGLGQLPLGTYLLTHCHLLLRYHHLVMLSNKIYNCWSFEAHH